MEDLGVLILDHPAIRPSQGLLSECMKNNVAVVMCDEKHLPASVLHHHNQYDGFCLADDLMEPLRPMVDRRVRLMRDEPKVWGEELELKKEEKRELLGVLADQAQFGGESYLLLTALQYYAAGVRRVGCGEEKETEIPRP